MPEVPSNLIGFINHSVKYLWYIPFMHLSYYTGRVYLPPYSAGIFLNTRCNLNCSHCFMNVQEDFPDLLKIEEMYKIIDEIYRLGIRQITLCGGELFMYKGLFDIIRYIHRYQIMVGFTTNGTLMTDNMIRELFDSGLDRISISIDGNETVHDSIRGKGNYERTVKNLDQLIDKNSKERKLTIRINTVVMNANLECLSEIFDFVKIRNLEWIIIPFVIWDGEFANRLRVQSPNTFRDIWIPRERISLLRNILDELKRRKIKEGILFNPDRFLKMMKEYYENPNFDSRKCMFGTYHFYIQGNGKVFLCDQETIGILGDINKKSLKEIWYSNEFVKARIKMSECHRCMTNCIYTPSLWEMIKDFIIYPTLRNSGITGWIF